MNVLNVLKSADFLNSVKVMWQSMLSFVGKPTELI